MTTYDTRALPRRRFYLGEGLAFELRTQDARLEAEAVDLTAQGIGLAVVEPRLAPLPQPGEIVTLRRAAVTQRAVVRNVASVRSFPRLGLSLLPEPAREAAEYPCPVALPAFASASCPWRFRELLHFRVLRLGAAGLTLRSWHPNAPLLAGSELELDLQLAFAGAQRCRARLTSITADEVGAEWIAPSRALQTALAQYLLAGDPALTPAGLRAGGLAVGSVGRAVAYDYAGSPADHEEILALRLHAHQAEGHLATQSIDDLRSPYDAHSRHLICRFHGRIVGYVRVIFVDRDPARSQYVSLGGHEVPPWLWEAGFVEAGAGAIHPDFQRAGLFVPLMAHSARVAVQSGHRFVLGACDDGLLGMYGDMGFERLETRIVEPKSGWRFRSHLIYLDAERILREPPASRSVAELASAIAFAGLDEREHVVQRAAQ